MPYFQTNPQYLDHPKLNEMHAIFQTTNQSSLCHYGRTCIDLLQRPWCVLLSAPRIWTLGVSFPGETVIEERPRCSTSNGATKWLYFEQVSQNTWQWIVDFHECMDWVSTGFLAGKHPQIYSCDWEIGHCGMGSSPNWLAKNETFTATDNVRCFPCRYDLARYDW